MRRSASRTCVRRQCRLAAAAPVASQIVEVIQLVDRKTSDKSDVISKQEHHEDSPGKLIILARLIRAFAANAFLMSAEKMLKQAIVGRRPPGPIMA